MKRRAFIAGCAGGIGAASMAVHAQAPWPPRLVKLVVPFPAGGGVDLISRYVAERLKARWSQNVIVDNRAGANSIIGAEYVLGQPKDGTTLMVTTSATFLLPYIMQSVRLRPVKDFTAIGEVIVDQLVVYARADSPARSINHFVEQERRSPGTVNVGSYGIGSNPHLLLIELNRQFGVSMMHVPYKGAGLLAAAVIGGEVQIGTGPYAAVRGFIETGRVRPLAVFGASRLPLLPNVPTLHESGVSNFEFSQWTGLFAATGTPDAILNRIGEDLRAVLKAPGIREELADRGTVPGVRIGSDFQQVVERDTELLGRMNVAAGIRME